MKHADVATKPTIRNAVEWKLVVLVEKNGKHIQMTRRHAGLATTQVVADHPVDRRLVTLVERRGEHFHLQRKRAGLATKLTVHTVEWKLIASVERRGEYFQ